MAKFYEITGYYIGYDKTPSKRIINIDHIISMCSDKENANITYISLSNELTMVVGHSVKEILNILKN